MQPLLLISHLSLLAAGAVSQPSADEVLLQARPEAGIALTRTLTSTAALRGGDLTVEMDGQPVPAQFLPVLTFEVAAREHVEVVDTVSEAKGRETSRRFVDLASSVTVDVDLGGYMGAEDEHIEGTAASPLAGRTVRFREPAEGGAPEVEFADRAAESAGADDNELLAGLALGLDLAGLLPSEPVAEGAAWTAPASALAELFQPGGKLAWRWSDPAAEQAVDSEQHSGEVELALVALADVDGRQVARIRVGGTPGRTQVRATDLRDVPVTQGTATETRTATLTVAGELLFDVAGGHLAAADLTVDVAEVQRTVKDPGQEGPDYESTLTFAGRHTFELRVRRGD